MKFNTNNYPILGMFNESISIKIAPSDEDIASDLILVIEELWDLMKLMCSKEIFYMTNAFMTDIEKAVISSTKGGEEYYENFKSELFTKGSGVFISENYTQCFYVDPREQIYCSLGMANVKGYIIPLSFVFDHPQYGDSRIAWASCTVIDNPEHNIRQAVEILMQVMSTYHFVRCSDPHTKILLQPMQKLNGFATSYINETPLLIQILDGRWLTNLFHGQLDDEIKAKNTVNQNESFQQTKETIFENFWKRG